MHVGALRLQLVESGDGLIQDAAIIGHGQDQDQVGALLFLHPGRAAALAPQALQDALHATLQRLRSATTGSSLFVQRALVTAEAPSMGAGEINDTGYLNQRAVLTRCSDAVARVYGTPQRALAGRVLRRQLLGHDDRAGDQARGSGKSWHAWERPPAGRSLQ